MTPSPLPCCAPSGWEWSKVTSIEGGVSNLFADSAAIDTESVPLLRSIGMAFDKEFEGMSGGNINGLTDSEGVTVIYDAQIDLTKYVSVDGGESWQDANALTGPLLSHASGIDPLFKYTALNNGTVTLKNLTLSDEAFDLNGGADGSDWLWGDLAPGDLAEYIFDAPFALEQNSGDAQVMASTAYAPVQDIDNAYYLGV